MVCPVCGYELRGLPIGPDGERTCPECGQKLTQRDLSVLMREDDPAGRPATLDPHEVRVNGRLALVLFIMAIAAVVGAIWLVTVF